MASTAHDIAASEAAVSGLIVSVLAPVVSRWLSDTPIVRLSRVTSSVWMMIIARNLRG
jgi:MFS-type transporter involved in bile tolerance (Atg22 family)